MHEIDMSADELVSSLLGIAETEPVCILDSCGAGHLGSHLLIAGIEPRSIIEFSDNDPEITLSKFDSLLSGGEALFFSMSYDFGMRVQRIVSRHPRGVEPDLFAATFETLLIHDYESHTTYFAGDDQNIARLKRKLRLAIPPAGRGSPRITAASNFTKAGYLQAIQAVKEHICGGDTYQSNLTQCFDIPLGSEASTTNIFLRLRKQHPASFAAYFKRLDSTVISASPERFFKLQNGRISTSPIKGTRERGEDSEHDERLRRELLESPKDIAENTMIVDLLRNDLGRVCEFGSVEVEKLCDLEEHSTLFHLVSTVAGKLRAGTAYSDIIRALFPCGSITGAPKLSTMRIIDDIEPTPRGLSMGALGYYVPGELFGVPELLETSVAIRTMVVREDVATFNVGGGIVIDSDPESEYRETLTKAKALFSSLGVGVS
ncbi:MAG: anthranilate synthase component I family protein [Acidobacteriota bacterium]